MKEVKEEKSFVLEPSWKQYFLGYLFGILTIPLAGMGLIVLYLVRKKHKETKYIVTDTQISSVDARYRRNVDLVNIESVTIHQTWMQKQLDVGTVILSTSASEMELTGMEHPAPLKSMLEKAIQTEIQRRQEANRTKPEEPIYDPGSMDKMEYLTGLWQQGLISEEDYEKERKHFE